MQKLFDKFGFTFSVICLIHCLIVPVLLLAIPTLTVSFIDEHIFHELSLFFVLPVAMISLFIGCRDHTDNRKFIYVVWSFLIGVLLLLYGMLTHNLHDIVIERILTVVGTIMIAIGHVINHNLCKKRTCHTEHTH